MANLFSAEKIIGKKVQGVRVTPISLKIVALFVVFLLLSNFISNFINLTFNRHEQIRLTTELLVRDLKDLYLFASNQHKMYAQIQKDLDLYTQQMAEFASNQFKAKKSLAVAIDASGGLVFQAGPRIAQQAFPDTVALATMTQAHQAGKDDGAVEFNWNGERYFGIYRFSPDWNAIMIRAEEWNEFYEPSVRIFSMVSVLILVLTTISVVIGILLIRYILRFVGRITESIMAMQQHQSMDMIDMKGAPPDDVAYLGIAMNSLSSTIQNLLNIFKKFVARDIAQKAYREREIRLEGSKKELAIMFSDIKSFTYMTETLGTDIIKLLNLHYNRAINRIHSSDGDIGSIIGDALLAIFGTMPSPGANKSLQAITAGYEVLEETDKLRSEMEKRKQELIKSRGYLTENEEKVYEAVRLEVGVGIDGGEVFYGNIGSVERMVNTVIGDNVNSASRLEGLTRVYRVPMIVSDFIREETMRGTNEYFFLELDQVQVKGKTVGKRVFYPIPTKSLDTQQRKECERYALGLAAYYEGKWKEAHEHFTGLSLPPALIFLERTKSKTPPQDWNGVWTMKDK